MQIDNDLEKTNKKGHMYLLILFILMMREMSKKEKVELSDLEIVDNRISRDRKLAFLFVLLTINAYLWSFYTRLGLNFAVDPGDWGTFGDFVGGLLNPTFALLAFFWLTSSIRLQLKELQETRKQIQESTIAQQDTAKHQHDIAKLDAENVATQNRIAELQEKNLESQLEASRLQRQQISIQNFEGLFFELLKTKTEATSDILVGSEETLITICTEYQQSNSIINNMTSKSRAKVQGKESIKSHMILFKSYSKVDWEKFYIKSMLDYTGSYFRVCYQIVNLIDKNLMFNFLPKQPDKDYCLEQKKYFDIFRSTLTQHELEAFFFNCLSIYGRGKFKKLIEKYGLFEPLLIDFHRLSEKRFKLTRYAYQYEISAFEKNKDFIEYFSNVELLKDIDADDLLKEIILLRNKCFIKFVEQSDNRINHSLYEDQRSYREDIIVLDDYRGGGGLIDNFNNTMRNWYKNIESHKISIKNIQEDYFKIGKVNSNVDESGERSIDFHLKEISFFESEIKKFQDIIFLKEISILVNYGMNFIEFNEYFNKKFIIKKYLMDFKNLSLFKTSINSINKINRCF